MNNVMTLREARRSLRREICRWQWAAAGLLVLSVTVNACQMAVIGRMAQADKARDAEDAHWETRYYAAVEIEHDLVQSYKDLLRQVEAEQEARAAQAAAYEALGDWQYIGECTVTYYCPCEQCCGRWADGLTATGLPAGPGIVAVDPGIIPLGSTVVIDGQKYLAADTGVKGYHVDVCVATHQESVERGVRTAEVWVICEE